MSRCQSVLLSKCEGQKLGEAETLYRKAGGVGRGLSKNELSTNDWLGANTEARDICEQVYL